jgi:Flp pilus assembly protein TadB
LSRALARERAFAGILYPRMPMAQTKRKRRTKHRGNAAGIVESRGRTGRRLTPEEQRKANAAGGGRRVLRQPTWKSASIKSGVMALLLFVMTQVGFLVKDATIMSGIAVAAVAMLLYTPLAYTTDKWAYSRQQRRMAQQGRS